MDLTFEVAEMPGVRLLSVKTVSDAAHFGEDISRVIGSIHKAVNGWADGPPFCLYPEPYDPDQIVAIAGIPYRGDPMYGYDTTDVPPSRAVLGHFEGAVGELAGAWREAMAYVAEHGFQPTGAPYERYLAPTSVELVVPVA